MSKKQTQSITNAQAVIDALPEQSKRMVMFSLVGSLNSSIISTAAAVVSRANADLAKTGGDFKELTGKDIEILMAEPDWRMDTLLDIRRAMSVANDLRDQLIQLTNDDSIASIKEAIDYRSRPAAVRTVNRQVLKQTLIAARVVKADVTDETLEQIATASEKQQAQENERQAERIAANRGHIEWVIDQVFQPASYSGEPDNIEDLPRELRAKLYDVIRSKIDTERLACVTELMSTRRTPRYTMSDATLLADCADMANGLDAHLETANID